MSHRAFQSLLPDRWTEVIGFAAVYVALAALSLSTAYVQVNAAAVWIPTGFAFGLLIVRGDAFWPAVTLGSFVANLWVNIGAQGEHSAFAATLVAACIAIANTAEALLGSYLANRYAGGVDFFNRPRDVGAFVLIVAPIPPIVSTLVGVAVSRVGGFAAIGAMPEVILTWYIANTVGILVVTGLTVLILTGRLALPPGSSFVEAAALALLLVFFGQAICGVYFSQTLAGWPKTYMIIPLLLWASIRFGQSGAQLSIVLIALISVVGTMRGYQAFPAESPSRSLIYLQIFLGILSVMTLFVSSATTMAEDLRANLEERVRTRTREVEHLLRERELFTTLVAHDLQSPIFGVRNALRAASKSIEADQVEPREILEVMGVMEETCTAIAERVEGLLTLRDENTLPEARPSKASLSSVASSIKTAHCLAMSAKSVSLRFVGDMNFEVSHTAQLEYILDILIDNAVRVAPPHSEIEVAAYRHGHNLEVLVSDSGPGMTKEQAKLAFRGQTISSRAASGTRPGMGLYLATEYATGLGGRLTYTPVSPTGARFRLVVPV